MCKKTAALFLIVILFLCGKSFADNPFSGGTSQTITNTVTVTGPLTDNQLRTTPITIKEYLIGLAEGDIAGHSTVRKNAYNGDIDDTQEDLWAVGGAYVFPTAGMRMNVVSSAAADNSAGTGIRTVELSYLDNSYAEKTETITLTGTTPVLTTATDIYRVQRMHTLTAGTGAAAAGNVDIRNMDNTTIYGRILTGYNTIQQGIWTVPAGKTFYVTGWSASAGSKTANNYVEFRLRATCGDGSTLTPGIFRQFASTVLVMGGTDFRLTIPFKVPAQADVKLSAIGSASTANYIVSGHFVGWHE